MKTVQEKGVGAGLPWVELADLLQPQEPWLEQVVNRNPTIEQALTAMREGTHLVAGDGKDAWLHGGTVYVMPSFPMAVGGN